MYVPEVCLLLQEVAGICFTSSQPWHSQCVVCVCVCVCVLGCVFREWCFVFFPKHGFWHCICALPFSPNNRFLVMHDSWDFSIGRLSREDIPVFIKRNITGVCVMIATVGGVYGDGGGLFQCQCGEHKVSLTWCTPACMSLSIVVRHAFSKNINTCLCDFLTSFVW